MPQKPSKNKMLSQAEDDELDDMIASDPDDHTLEEASLPHDEEYEEEDPEEDANADHDEAIELVREIQELAEEMPEKGESFAESTTTKALAIQQTIEENERVTPGQLTALRNMKAGMEKWIR